VQKQQGKQIMIDLFMSTFVSHHLVDIVMMACGAINCDLPTLSFTTSNPPGVFNTSTVRGRSNMRVKNVRYGMQTHHLQISGYYSSATLFVNTTTKPHATINLQTSYTKGSGKLKGKKWTSGKFWLSNTILIDSLSLPCFKQA
jgi:hypothetical protein